jgi:hypothetical protein
MTAGKAEEHRQIGARPVEAGQVTLKTRCGQTKYEKPRTMPQAIQKHAFGVALPLWRVGFRLLSRRRPKDRSWRN